MNYTFAPEAKKELNRTMNYYEGKEPGLGGAFHSEIVHSLGNIIDHPDMWPKASRRTRRCLTGRFPYSVIYYYDRRQQHIVIVAIANNRQRPGYWKDRL